MSKLDALYSKNTPKMPVRKAIVFAGTGNCPMCGKTVKLRPFNSKLRYSHKCPHGMDCDQGNRLIGVHTFKPEHSRCDQCRAAPNREGE